jgi:hypothetical protein
MKARPIIGIAGDIGAGKDTTAKAIQYGMIKAKVELGLVSPTLIPPLSAISDSGSNIMSAFEIRKFADKLKDIVCMLIGCKRYELEQQKFKQMKLGPEWGGITVREMLQRIGTDLFRKGLSENTWVNATFADVKPDSMWIISDMRFPNEFDKIKTMGGITIKVVRFQKGDKVLFKGKEYTVDLTASHTAFLTDGAADHRMEWFDKIEKVYPKDRHISETALDGQTFDYVIYNCSNEEDLVMKVEEILKKENLVYHHDKSVSA